MRSRREHEIMSPKSRLRQRAGAATELSFGRRLLQQVHGMTPDILLCSACRFFVVAALPSYAALAGSALAVRHVVQILRGPVGGALVQRFGPRQAHVAFRCIRRRAGSELLNGGAVLMLAASAIAIGLLRSALNFDPAKTQVRR